MLNFTRRLTPQSAVAYGVWRLRESRQPILLRLRSGPQFELRPGRDINNDYGVAYEIFVEKLYDDARTIPRDSVSFIVDLGANVGYSLLYWLNTFSSSRIV